LDRRLFIKTSPHKVGEEALTVGWPLAGGSGWPPTAIIGVVVVVVVVVVVAIGVGTG
jgi:hypothetical protein